MFNIDRFDIDINIPESRATSPGLDTVLLGRGFLPFPVPSSFGVSASLLPAWLLLEPLSFLADAMPFLATGLGLAER